MPTFQPGAPTWANAGSLQGWYVWVTFGSQSGIIALPSAPVVIGGIRVVTLSTIDDTLPTVTISDDDLSVFTSVVGQPANQAQWTAVAANARSQGGNRVHIVFPNAIHKGTSPRVEIWDFNPLGS